MESSSDQRWPWATVGQGCRGEYAWLDLAERIGDAWGRHLPHWRQRGAIYFVTFRTADSLPAPLLAELTRERDAWLAAHPEPRGAATLREYHQRFTERMHAYLDAGHGECPFRSPEARAALEEVLRARDGTDDGYLLDTFVIMPNHVHALVSPRGDGELSQVTKVWKSVSAHRVNRAMGRRGALWQQESWDHIVRSAEHLARFRRYIEENPKRKR